MKLSVSALFTRDHHYKLSAFMLCFWSSCECFRDYWMRKRFSVWAPLICEVITGSFQLFSLNVSHVCSPSVWLSGSGVLSGGWLGGLVWKEKEGRIVIGWCRGANAVSRRGVSTQKGTERERKWEKESKELLVRRDQTELIICLSSHHTHIVSDKSKTCEMNKKQIPSFLAQQLACFSYSLYLSV